MVGVRRWKRGSGGSGYDEDEYWGGDSGFKEGFVD